MGRRLVEQRKMKVDAFLIKISVHLHTILQIEGPEGPIRELAYQVRAGSRIEDLLAELDIVLSPEAILLAVNGRMAGVETVLQAGDRVDIMPAISGGIFSSNNSS